MNYIEELLAVAAEHETAAREARKAAGRILAGLRADALPQSWPEVLRQIGMDPRTADLLIELGCGGREHGKG